MRQLLHYILCHIYTLAIIDYIKYIVTESYDNIP